jgi:hypothetical protein
MNTFQFYLPFVCPGVDRHSSIKGWFLSPISILAPSLTYMSALAPLSLLITLRHSGNNDFRRPLPVIWSAWTCVLTEKKEK